MAELLELDLVVSDQRRVGVYRKAPLGVFDCARVPARLPQNRQLSVRLYQFPCPVALRVPPWREDWEAWRNKHKHPLIRRGAEPTPGSARTILPSVLKAIVLVVVPDWYY